MNAVGGTPSSSPMRDCGVDASGNEGGFASRAHSGPGARRSSPAAPSAPGSPLAAPEVDAGRGGRAMAGGSGLLDELHELDAAGIEGWLSEDDLHRLASLVEQAGRELGGPPSSLEEFDPRAAEEPARPGGRAS